MNFKRRSDNKYLTYRSEITGYKERKIYKYLPKEELDFYVEGV